MHALLLWVACQDTTEPLESSPSGPDSAPVVEVERIPGLDLEAPTVEPGRGVYEGPLTLTLSSADSLRYTLDGSDPLGAEGLIYEGPVTLDGTERAVRLRAVALAERPSDELSATYVFVEPTLAQPAAPEGFPSTWGVGSSIAGDYEMDPEVLDEDHERARSGLLELPALVVWMDNEDLFGQGEGLYMHPDEEGQDWERAAVIEWLDPEGPGVSSGSGLRIQGGSSTGDWKSPKVSMRLLFKEIYGASKLDYPLFPDSEVQTFDCLILDAHLNQTWVHPSTDQQTRADYLRDRTMSDLQNGMGSLAPHGRFANLFLNGLYWGLYEVHERPDESFAAAWLGGDKDDYDVLKHTSDTVVAGDNEAWLQALDLARGDLEEADYAALTELVDVQDLADYMLLNFYGGNEDWPHHNWYAARRDLPGERWRFFSWDAEHVLKDVNRDVTDQDDAGSPAELFQSLLKSAEFRDLLGERIELHLAEGGALQVDRAPLPLLARRAEIDDAIVLESARWGDYRRAQPYTRADWLVELAWIEDTWFPARSDVLRAQFEARGWVTP